MTRTNIGNSRCAWGALSTWALALSLLFALASGSSFAQTITANLAVTVSDPSGAVIGSASVTVTNVSTGVAASGVTSAQGDYIFPSLIPGTYNIKVEKAGFRTELLSGVELLVDQKARVEVKLQVGDVNATVKVEGEAPQVDTATASVGTVIGTQEAVSLPLNTRRFGALAALVPGTTTDNGGQASAEWGSPFSETTYTANGARSASNEILIDGVESRNLTLGGFALQPTPDAVQEFKIQTNIYSANFGTAAGSTINLVTKSGSNQLHGTLYEFVRNDMFDAQNYFATFKPEYHRNQFGGAIGGPIIKNKIFFFANFESLRQIQGSSLTSTVPTPSQLAGNLSGALTGNTINLCGAGGPANLNFDSGQLFDPGTETLTTCPGGSANAGSQVLTGTPIPGNIITNIDPVAQKVLSLGAFPAPNRAGFPNFVNQQGLPRNDYQVDARVDYNMSAKDQLFVRYLFGQANITDYSSAYDLLPGFSTPTYFRGQNVALGWTRTIGPHLLNEARAGFQRDYDISSCASCPYPSGFMAGLGIQNFQALTPSLEGFPFFGFNNFSGFGDQGYAPTISPDMVETYQDNLTWTHGRHVILVGGDMRFWQVLGESEAFSAYGQFFYDGQYSGLAGEVPDATGVSDLGDFLLGYPDNAGRTLHYQDTNQVGGGFWSAYAQDDIRVNRNLSLNVGLRYEYRPNPVDKNNNYVTFVPLGPKFSGPGDGVLVTAADNALNDSFCTNSAYSYLLSSGGNCLVATSAQRAALGFTGRTRRTLIFQQRKDFAPRFGLVWRPTSSDKLVLRTGYGIFYDLPNFNNMHFVNDNPIFSPNQLYNTAFGTPPPLTNGAPTTTESVFAGNASTLIPPLTQQFTSLYVSPHYKAPYFQQWSFGLSSQLAANWALEVDYVGSKGTKLGFLHLFANQPEPGLGDLQPRRPYPDFNIMLFTTSDANSSYNALQTKLSKRFSNGFTFLTSYTWAHSIDDNEGDEGFSGGVGNRAPQDDNDPEADRARSANDARNRLVFSGVWDLPIGQGKRFLGNTGWLNNVIGGWQTSAIVSYQSGFPFTVQSGQDFSNTGSSNPRPDRTCGGEGQKTVNSWFNTNCFTTAALAAALASGQPRFGDSGRNILEAPGLENWDLAILKNFTLSERFKLEFRSEFYNAFNRPFFGNPGTVIGSPTFGVVTTAGSPRDIQFGLKLSY
jgi:hypothetical protein